MIEARSCDGVHPRTDLALALSATSAGESPSRRSAYSTGNALPGHSSDRRQQFLHRRAVAGAQIERHAFAAVEQILDRPGMGVGEIHHMNEIAHAGAVARIVVGAEHLEAGAAAERRLDGQRDGMGFRRMPFADPPFGIGAGGIEIAQHDGAEALVAIEIAEHLLDDQLAAPIGIDRQLRMRLVHRDGLGHAIGGAGGREHQPADAGILGGGQQAQRSRDIVLEERGGVLHRLADLDQRGEMHDRPPAGTREAPRRAAGGRGCRLAPAVPISRTRRGRCSDCRRRPA